MKTVFQCELKKYLREELLKTRYAKALSQEKMAPFLEISTRALGSVEDGDSCPSLVTFLFFCYRLCPEPDRLLRDIFSILTELEKNDS